MRALTQSSTIMVRSQQGTVVVGISLPHPAGALQARTRTPSSSSRATRPSLSSRWASRTGAASRSRATASSSCGTVSLGCVGQASSDWSARSCLSRNATLAVSPRLPPASSSAGTLFDGAPCILRPALRAGRIPAGKVGGGRGGWRPALLSSSLLTCAGAQVVQRAPRHVRAALPGQLRTRRE